MDQSQSRIGYQLMDETSGKIDSFFFDVYADSNFSMSKHFTGIEWHNRSGNIPYPIRFKVEISNLAYGINDNLSDLRSVAYFPYNQLLPDERRFCTEISLSLFMILRPKMDLSYTKLVLANTIGNNE